MITPVYPPYRGGMGAVAAAQVRELKARQFEVDVLTPAYRDRPRGHAAIALPTVIELGNAALVPSLLFKLDGYDVVHLHYPFYGGAMFVWLWSMVKRRPYVLTYHMQAKTNDWRNVIFKLHRWLVEPFILRRAETVMVSSLDYAHSINLRHRHLVELPFGVDEQRFFPGRDDEFRAQYNIPSSTCTFIFVGGLDKAHSFKGVEVLIKAAAELSHDQDWRVLIVGDGDLRTEYLELAKTLKVSDRIVFAGNVSDDDLARVYRAVDVHVLPSTTRSEAFGLVTLEAAASGLPSLVSDLPGVRTLVDHGQTGFAVEPGNVGAWRLKMAELTADPELIKRLGSQARERILQGYTQSVLADRLVEVYKDSISEL